MREHLNSGMLYVECAFANVVLVCESHGLSLMLSIPSASSTRIIPSFRRLPFNPTLVVSSSKNALSNHVAAPQRPSFCSLSSRFLPNFQVPPLAATPSMLPDVPFKHSIISTGSRLRGHALHVTQCTAKAPTSPFAHTCTRTT